jgi:hypothetical protein
MNKNEVYAMRGQNVAAGTLLQSIVKLTDAFAAKGYPPSVRIMLTVHDSFTFNIPRVMVREVYEETIRPILSRPVPELGDFVFPHECEVGPRWDWDCISYEEWVKVNG